MLFSLGPYCSQKARFIWIYYLARVLSSPQTPHQALVNKIFRDQDPSVSHQRAHGNLKKFDHCSRPTSTTVFGKIQNSESFFGLNYINPGQTFAKAVKPNYLIWCLHRAHTLNINTVFIHIIHRVAVQLHKYKESTGSQGLYPVWNIEEKMCYQVNLYFQKYIICNTNIKLTCICYKLCIN